MTLPCMETAVSPKRKQTWPPFFKYHSVPNFCDYRGNAQGQANWFLQRSEGNGGVQAVLLLTDAGAIFMGGASGKQYYREVATICEISVLGNIHVLICLISLIVTCS